MGRIISSAQKFIANAWALLGSALMTVFNPDPFEAVRPFLPVGWDAYLPSFTDHSRQLLFLAITIAIAFWWFHKNETKWEDKQPVEPDMPIHEAMWYIAGKSRWATQQSVDDDGSWVFSTQRVLFTALAGGGLAAFGRRRANRRTDLAFSEIPADVFNAASFDSHLMVTNVPPAIVRRSERTEFWMRVKLNRAQVTTAFPAKWWWQKTAIQRIDQSAGLGQKNGYQRIHRSQNEAYNFSPESALVVTSAVSEVFADE